VVAYRGPVRRILFAVGAFILLVAAGFGVWMAIESRKHPLPTIETTRRRLEYEGLTRYAAREQRGHFLPPDAITIALDERFVQRVISSSLPFEAWVKDSTIQVRLESAKFDIERGFGRVVLSGTGRLVADTTMFADLLIQGVVGLRSVDFSTEHMGLRINITDVEVVRSGPSGLVGGLANPVVAFFGRKKAADLNELEPKLDIPLQIAHSIDLPESEGDIDVPAASLPLRTRVVATTSFGDCLVASIELMPDSVVGVPAGPPEGPWDAPPGALSFATVRKATAQLLPSQKEVEELSRRVAGLAGRDSLWQAIVTSERDITVIVPGTVVEDLVDRIASRYRTGITIDVETEIKEEVSEDLHVKVLGKKVKAGDIDLDIRIRRLGGRLVASRSPTTTLLPPDGVQLDFPLAIHDGHGVADIRAHWDPTAAAWLVCRGFDARRTLTGSIRPIPYILRGRLRFEIGPDRILARPTLRRDKVRLRIDLTQASWDSLRTTFMAQDKFLKCGMVMDPDTVVAKLKQLGARGIKVRLPGAAPPFDLPVRFEQSMDVGAVRVDVAVHDPAVIVREHYVQLGLDAELVVAREPDALPPPATSSGVRTSLGAASTGTTRAIR
jgi:hypothetical protein